jgi:hypothetical protein
LDYWAVRRSALSKEIPFSRRGFFGARVLLCVKSASQPRLDLRHTKPAVVFSGSVMIKLRQAKVSKEGSGTP